METHDTNCGQDWARDGYCIVRGVAGAPRVIELRQQFERALESDPSLEPHGVRMALARFAWVREVACSPGMLNVAQALLGPGARPVKGILFDKLPGANWKVPPHQDLTICVKQRRDVEGFGPWSVKDGIDHVQPPAAVMQSIVALRLHLDDCPASNGALRVVPGSHRFGRLSQEDLLKMKHQHGECVCEALAGDVLAMSPLVVHSSAPTEQPHHRRVLHVEYSALDLPGGLEWHEAETGDAT